MQLIPNHEICIYTVTSRLGLEIGLKLSEFVESKCKELDVKYMGLVTESDIDRIPTCLVSVVAVATGGTEHVIMRIAEKSTMTYLLYTEEYNSLPATLEALSYLREHGLNAEAKPLDESIRVLNTLKRVVNAYKKIKTCKLGIIGGKSPWLVFSETDEKRLKEVIGNIVYIPMDTLYKYIEESVLDEKLLKEVVDSARSVHVPVEEVAKALRVYAALKRIIHEFDLCGFTIKCFDLLTTLNTTACLAVSLFNKELLVAGCEGDVPLIVSMALGVWSTGKPAFMGNIASVKPGEVVIVHCTSYIPEGAPYELYTHFESGKGVGLRAEYPVGSVVTLFRVDPGLRRLRIGLGEIIRHEWRTTMCRTQIRVKLNNAEKLVKEPLGNHYAMILGNHVEELTLIAKLLGMHVEII